MLDELATIEKGKIADIIVVAGNPLESLEAMQWKRPTGCCSSPSRVPLGGVIRG
jgi:imidazolonepropionase-like amidohydrolase